MEYKNLRYRIASLMTLICALFCCNAAWAVKILPFEGEFYLDVPTIESTDPVQVNIMLENGSTPITAYSFTITLPNGLSIVDKSVAKTERFSARQTLSYDNNKFLVVSMNNEPFVGESGSVGSFQIKATPAFLESTEEQKITISKVSLSGPPENGVVIPYSYPNKNFNVKVEVADPDPVTVSLTSSADVFAANPGGSALVTLSLENNKPLIGMQFDITLPEGFTFDESGFQQSDRLMPGSEINPATKNGVTNVMIFNIMTNQILAEGDGSFVTFRVNVPDTFTADEATIKISTIKCVVNQKTYLADNTSVTLVNGLIAKNKADGVVTGLQTALDNALAEIAESCKDVKDQFTGAEIQTQIDDLAAKVEAAYNNLTLTPEYDDVMAPATEIQEAIDTLVAEAQAAQEEFDKKKGEQDALDQKFETGTLLVEGLQEKLTTAQHEIDQSCPDVKDNYQGETILAEIQKMQSALEEAYNNKTILDEYDTIVAPAGEIEQQIEKLISDAKTAQETFEHASGALRTAYENAHEELSKLNIAFDNAIAEIAETCPDVKDQFTGAAIKTQIESLATSIEVAFSDGTLADRYEETVTTTAGVIDQAIKDLVTAAKAAQDADDDEERQKVEAQTKYDNAMITVNQLRDQLATALADIKNYPCDQAIIDQFNGEAITTALDELAAQLLAAKEDLSINDHLNEYLAKVPGIEADINNLVAEAKAEQDKINAEKDLNAKVEAQKEKADKVVQGLKDELAEALNTIKTDYADVAEDFDGDAINGRIETLEASIAAIVDDKSIADETTYNNAVTTPAAGISEAITALVAAAKEAHEAKDAADKAEIARKNAYDEAKESAEELQNMYDMLIEQINEKCPDVKDDYQGTEIKTAIDQLLADIEKAYNVDKIPADEYKKFNEPGAAIRLDITKLMDDAQAAQEEYTKNQEEAKDALKAAQTEANAEVAKLNGKLQDALAEIDEKCPDVVDQFKGEDITAAIADLQKAIDDAFADGTLTDKKDEILKPVTSIQEQIDALVVAAIAAQKAHDDASFEDDLAAARANANNILSDLDNDLKQALETIEETCPDVKHLYTGALIQQKISVLRNKVNAAYDDKTLIDKMEDIQIDANTIDADIKKLVEDAQAAQKDLADADAALQEAYKNALDASKALETELTEALKTIEETCPDVAGLFEGKEIEARIKALNSAIKSAYNDKSLVADYDEVVTETAAEISESIKALVSNAQKAQNSHSEAEKAELARQQAYNNAKALAEGLQTQLDNALSNIAKECPNVKDQFKGDDVQKNIDALVAAIEKANTDKVPAEGYAEVTKPADAISASIEALVEAANVAQKEYNEAESANAEAAAKANALVADLSKKLTNTISEIASTCQNVADNFKGTDIEAAIVALQNSVDKAVKDGNIAATYEDVVAPAAGIEADIEKLLADAKAAQAAYDAESQQLQADYEKANGVISGLQSDYEAALATIAETCADVKDLFPGSAIQSSIDALKSRVETALAERSLTANYDGIMEPASTISDEIAKLITDAQAAQKAYDEQKEADEAAAAEAAAEAARQTAYTNASALVSQLQAQLDAALQTIAETCTDVKDQFNGTEISAEIIKMQGAIDAALADKSILENIDSLLAPQTTISADIAKLVEDAKAAQAELDAAKATLQGAYIVAQGTVADLQKEFDAALATIAETCEDVKDQFPGTSIQTQINALTNAVDAAYNDGTLVAKYDDVVTGTAQQITDAISALIIDAQAAQKAFDDAEDAAAAEAAAAAAAEAARQTAYTNASTLVSQLQAQLDAALANIAENCADVKDQYKGEAIASAIAQMQSNLDAALDDKTILDKIDTILAPQTNIQEQIAKLVEDATAAQKAYEAQVALEAARLKANGELAALDKALADALTEIENTCPDVKHMFTGSSIQQQITVLRNAVTAAYDDKTLADRYAEILAPAETINNAIAKLITDAQAAQQAIQDAETDRQKFNADAYAEDLGVIEGLREALDAAKIDIDENYSAYDYTKDYSKIVAAIDALKAKADKEYERVATEGKYNSPVDPANVEDMIEAMLEAAKAAQKAADDAEAARKDANEKAYEADLAAIQSAQDALDAAQEEIENEYPAYDASAEITDLQAAIDAEKAKADAEKAKTEDYGNYESEVNTSDITAQINAMIEAAKAAQKAADDAEAARKEANEKAYDEDMKAVDEAQDALDNALEEIRTKYPDYDPTDAAAAIQAAIDAEKAKAEAEKESTETEGNYESQVNNEAIMTMIEQMLDEAKTSGVEIIFGDTINEGDRVYTTDGKLVPSLQHGKINIIVKADGTRYKVFVK